MFFGFRYFDQILEDKSPIETQDYEAFFSGLSLTPSGINALIKFLQTNLTDIVEKVKHGETMITTIYSILASKVSTEDEIAEVKTFILTNRKNKRSNCRSDYYIIPFIRCILIAQL